MKKNLRGGAQDEFWVFTSAPTYYSEKEELTAGMWCVKGKPPPGPH